jgi:pyruvate dehydrogenase E1 component alpha subunit
VVSTRLTGVGGLIVGSRTVARWQQILQPNGLLVQGAVSPMGDDLVVEALELMVLSRAFDHKAVALNRQGAFGVYLEVFGQEASVVGSCLAVDPGRDWLVGQSREIPAYIHHGYPVERLAALFMGKLEAARIPDGVLMLPLQIAIGSQLPHAVGLAWGLRHQGADGVVICYFGEGAASEGDFHEACNLAGVIKAPVIFFLQNNGWAISTPQRQQAAVEDLASRAAGYGFPGVVVDGNDLLAVFKVTSDAARRAREGAGPTLIESKTFRLGAHNTTDNPPLYMDQNAYADAVRRDPIARVEKYLESRGLWDAERRRQLDKRVHDTIETAVELARRAPAPQPSSLFEHTYANPPARVLEQRRELLDQSGTKK